MTRAPHVRCARSFSDLPSNIRGFADSVGASDLSLLGLGRGPAFALALLASKHAHACVTVHMHAQVAHAMQSPSRAGCRCGVDALYAAPVRAWDHELDFRVPAPLFDRFSTRGGGVCGLVRTRRPLATSRCACDQHSCCAQDMGPATSGSLVQRVRQQGQ